jgi:RNA polymerase sigma factor (sigma-70 family)
MATKLKPTFESHGDIDLLHLMAAGDELAFDAWDEFYRRHAGYLYTFCKRVFTGRVGGHRIEEVVQDALIKAFHNAGGLESDAIDADDQRRVVRAWLETICRRTVSDYFRGQPTVDFVDDAELETIEADAFLADGKTNSLYDARLQVIDEALETLTEREREVIRTKMLWSEPGQKTKVPHEVLTEMEKSHDINPGNFRKIWERGMKKLRAYVESRPIDGNKSEEG